MGAACRHLMDRIPVFRLPGCSKRRQTIAEHESGRRSACVRIPQSGEGFGFVNGGEVDPLHVLNGGKA